jgi:hypothetical protein
MIDQATIQRYQPGGDLYAQYESLYGRNGALLIAQAALSGDRPTITDAIARADYGAALDDSTARLFWSQITTAPFDAPLSALNTGLGNTVGSFLRGVFSNPWVLLAAGLLVFAALGGFKWLEKNLKLA